SDASKDQRQEALKFLVHFVGDIHQPLHIGRKTDKGGNSISVKLFNKSGNLHSVWDSGLIKHRGLGWDAYAKELEGKVKPADKKKWLAVTDPADWATESHHLAEDHAYLTPNG